MCTQGTGVLKGDEGIWRVNHGNSIESENDNFTQSGKGGVGPCEISEVANSVIS